MSDALRSQETQCTGLRLGRSLVSGWLIGIVCSGVAPESLAVDDVSSSAEQVFKLLQTRCISCHGAEKQEGGLRLDTRSFAIAGGDRGAAIVPGDVDRSLLLKAISFADPDLQMPPKQRLTDREIRILTDWIRAGSAWPDDKPRPQTTDNEMIGDAFTDERNPIRQLFGGDRLDLWSLRSPGNRVHPQLQNSPEPEGSAVIDKSVRERLAQEQLTLSPEADPRTLIRRLSFDLLGLPPTAEDVEQFIEDSQAEKSDFDNAAETPDGAYLRLVNRLLDSPHYGERQARLWLDVVRYADTNGYERDEFRPLAWRYRDYVIRSFNQDKPFDQFIREQIAGDELVAGAPQSADEADMLIATGFLRLGQWDSTASIFQEEPRLRAEMMADLTNTTASAFLGLTMSCCQCHDHKYDPFSQADHYRLRAFFANVIPRDDLSISLPDEQTEIDRHNADLDQRITQLNQELETPDPDQSESAGRREELTAAISQLKGQRRSATVTMGATDSDSEAPATHLLYQGDFSSPRDVVLPGFVSLLAPAPAKFRPPRGSTTGRRLALAAWITSADNPWTARVIVNRIWQQHFGTGLVATPNDFGYSGAGPTHPELLDWLAVELMQRDWSIKELHRLIVSSATYRQQSRHRRQTAAESGLRDVDDWINGPAVPELVDPDNSLLWRQNVRRLDAEALRDSLLMVSGLLQPKADGKPIWPPVPDELLQAQPAILEAIEGKDDGRGQGWYADPVEQTDVRSIFLVRKRCLPVPFLQAFDLPDTTVSCARRDTTVVAPQALMLLNSPESLRYTQAFASQVSDPDVRIVFDDAAAAAELVKQVFRRALHRSPEPDEMELSIEFLRRHVAWHQQAADRAGFSALTDFCRAVLNLNEFVYID